MGLAIKFGFKNALEMPFNMFKNIMKQIITINEEEHKSLACWLRVARFADDKKFKELIAKSAAHNNNDNISESELIARLNKW